MANPADMSIDGAEISEEELSSKLAELANPESPQWHWFRSWNSDEEKRLEYARKILNQNKSSAGSAKVAATDKSIYVLIYV